MRRLALIAFLLAIAACSPGAAESTTTTSVEPTTAPPATTTTAAIAATTSTTPAETSFPVTVNVGGNEVTVDERPVRIVSLSPTATETLFAIGAGDQVVAVDEFSDYPAEAPQTDLSGFVPNIEAIAEYAPDMIIVSFDPEQLISSSFTPQGVTVITQFPAIDRDDLLAQMEQLGALTGHTAEAVALTGEIEERWDAAVSADAGGASIYLEVDPTFYSASSSSFMGSALADMGFANIADPADPDGFGFPQLSVEAIIEASPDVIVVGTDAGTSATDVASRPGWDVINAVANDQIVVIESNLSSRWGPRFVEYVEAMAAVADSMVTVDG